MATLLKWFDSSTERTKLVPGGQPQIGHYGRRWLVEFADITNTGKFIYIHLGLIEGWSEDSYVASVYISGITDTKRKRCFAQSDAHAWIVEQSKKEGLLFHRRLRLLSPLEQLAACAEEDQNE